jgi:hypothetical protein
VTVVDSTSVIYIKIKVIRWQDKSYSETFFKFSAGRETQQRQAYELRKGHVVLTHNIFISKIFLKTWRVFAPKHVSNNYFVNKKTTL